MYHSTTKEHWTLRDLIFMFHRSKIGLSFIFIHIGRCLVACNYFVLLTQFFENSFHPNIQHTHQYQFHFIFFGTKCDQFSFIRIEKVIFLCFHSSFCLLCWIHSFIHSDSELMIRRRFGCLLSLDQLHEKNE